MGRPKKDKEEILRKRRLAARKRQERIKNDPVLHQQQKEKNKKRYNRRKQEKKILPISEMTEKERKTAQKRNRDNFRAYYRRKKNNQLKTINEEVLIDFEESDCETQDPLHFTSHLVSTHSSYALRSKASQRDTRDKSSLQYEVTTDLIDQDLTQKTSNCNSPETSPVQHKVSTDLIDFFPPHITSNDSIFNDELSQSSDCTKTLTLRLSRPISASFDTTVVTTDLIDQDLTKKTSKCNSRETSPVKHKVPTDLIGHYPPQITSIDSTFTNSQSSDCTMTLTSRLSRAVSVSSDTTVTEQNKSEDNADYTVQDSSSCATPSSHSSVCSRRSVEKPKRPINSPSLVFKRYKYKVNKEMARLRRKVDELKKERDKFRKQALRLKSIKMLPKKRAQKEKKTGQKKNSSENYIQAIEVENQTFLELNDNGRICSVKREQ